MAIFSVPAMQDTVIERAYDEMLTAMRSRVDPAVFDLWFQKIRLVRFFRGTLTLGVPNLFHRDWIADHYQASLEEAAFEAIGSPITIDLIIDPELFRERRDVVKRATELASNATRLVKADRLRLETFVTAPENDCAVRAVRHLVDDCLPKLNPLVIVGPPGVGKTHLLSALGRELRSRKDGSLRVLHTDAEQFTMGFTSALRNRCVEDFRASFEDHDVLLFDEVHRLKGRRATQREFLTLLTRLSSGGQQIVLAGRHHPKEIYNIDSTLVSLFLAGMFVQIKPYNSDSLSSITEATGLGKDSRPVDPEVVKQLAPLAKGSVRDLQYLLMKVQAYATLRDERLDLSFVIEHLNDLRPSARSGTEHLEAVVDGVAEALNFTPDEMRSKRKVRALILPRAVAVCLLKDTASLTYKEIGRLLGGRSHTSICLMYQKYREQIYADQDLSSLMNRVSEQTLGANYKRS